MHEILLTPRTELQGSICTRHRFAPDLSLHACTASICRRLDPWQHAGKMSPTSSAVSQSISMMAKSSKNGGVLLVLSPQSEVVSTGSSWRTLYLPHSCLSAGSLRVRSTSLTPASLHSLTGPYIETVCPPTIKQVLSRAARPKASRDVRPCAVSQIRLQRGQLDRSVITQNLYIYPLRVIQSPDLKSQTTLFPCPSSCCDSRSFVRISHQTCCEELGHSPGLLLMSLITVINKSTRRETSCDPLKCMFAVRHRNCST